MSTNIRESNEVTQFQAESIASWDADIEKMKEVGFSEEDKDETSLSIKKKMTEDFFNRDGKLPKVFRTNHRRVYSPLTGMSRKMRQFLTDQGKQLNEIDAANSQPLLLVYKLKRNGFAVEDELTQIVVNGKFYDLFKTTGRTRDKVKIAVFTFMYATKINIDHKVYQILNSRFPKFTNSLLQYLKGLQSLSILLHEIESNIWIDFISAACMHAGIKHATIHDSIVFPGDNKTANYVLDIIYAAFGDIKPTLHIQTLDGKAINYERTPSNKMDQYIEKARGFKWSFWKLNEKGYYTFDALRMTKYLQSIGIYRYYTTKLDYMLIRIIDNIVDTIDIPTIKHLIINYVEEVGNQKILDSLVYSISKLINETSLHLLEPKVIEIFRGEKDAIYIFYADLIAKVTKEEITSVFYSDFHHYIWKNTILDRKFPDEDRIGSSPGEFEIFFKNVVKNEDNQLYVRQILGYALQRYRKLSDMKAIVVSDDNIDDQAKGGTGKGIIGQSLSQFLPTVKENGKSFKADIPFSYQNITLDTRLFIIDDVSPHFDITKLFSFLTDGIFIEKKHMQPFFLNPTDLPVVFLTSNYGLKGSDDSHTRRRLDVGIDKHYTPINTPAKEFGHDLFREWKPGGEEWIKFDIFMLKCAFMFMYKGIREYTNPNLAIKQFKADTHIDFEDFAEGFELNIDINKTATLKKLRELISHPKLSKTMMTKWIKKFANLKNYSFGNDRRNDTFRLTSL